MQNKAALDALTDAGLESYQYMAALDARTCPRCGGLDGKIFSLEEKMQGENAPPMHPRCRCTITAVLGDYGKRSAKVKGRREKVPLSMSYAEWKELYIDKTKTLDEWIVPKSFETVKVYEGRLDNVTVRKWYIFHDERIHDKVKNLPKEEAARAAFELRNKYRTQARKLMADENARKELERKYPNKTFEELIADKMNRKGLTRVQAIEDIFKTAIKSNEGVNKKLGLKDE